MDILDAAIGRFTDLGNREDDPEVRTDYVALSGALRYIRDAIRPEYASGLTFKAGEYVKDIRDDNVYEVMQDSDGPTLQLRHIQTNAPAICLINYLVKIEKQTPFQVGNWVQDTRDGEELKVLDIFGSNAECEMRNGGKCLRLKMYLEKIAPPAARFTVGDCVRPTSHGVLRLQSDLEDYETRWADLDLVVLAGPDEHDVYVVVAPSHKRRYWLQEGHFYLTYRPEDERS